MVDKRLKEELFFTCLGILVIFESFYCAMHPAFIWSIGVGALSGFIVLGALIGCLSAISLGISFLASGLELSMNEGGTRIIFIFGSVLNLMFQLTLGFKLGDDSYSIPFGVGFLYPTVYNTFVISGDKSFFGFIGMVLLTAIALIMIVCGLLMAGGTHD